MRFGICASVDALTLAADAACDYIEPPVAILVPDQGDSAFAPARERFGNSALKAETFNAFLPPSLKITGPAADFHALSAYVKVAAHRAAQIGGRVIVFGSGGARAVPQGFPRPQAETQIIDFLKMAGDYAAENDLVIAVEPLRPAECNIINFVSEACDFARRANHPAVKVLADLYHVFQGNDPLANIAAAGRLLAHTHIAEAVNRDAPRSGDGTDYTGFFAALKRAGFDGRCSIECRWTDQASQAPIAIRYLRELWQRTDS